MGDRTFLPCYLVLEIYMADSTDLLLSFFLMLLPVCLFEFTWCLRLKNCEYLLANYYF